MKKLDKYQIIGIIGIVTVLIAFSWFENGGREKMYEYDQRKFETILDNM